MKTGITVKEFLALPEGQKLMAGLIIVVGTLCTVASLLWYEGTRKEAKINYLTEHWAGEVVRISRACDSSKNAIREKCELEKVTMLNNTIADLRERFAIKEQQLDAAMKETHSTIRTQRMTQRRLKTLTKQLSTDENE